MYWSYCCIEDEPETEKSRLESEWTSGRVEIVPINTPTNGNDVNDVNVPLVVLQSGHL